MIEREHRAIFTEQLRSRRGRPRGVPVVVTTVKIPVPVYDAYARQALANGVSVHALLRARLSAGMRPRDTEDDFR
jgi:hypothetical protein